MLPKKHRLNEPQEFKTLKSLGYRFKSEHFFVSFLKDDSVENSKFTVVVSKKVSPQSPTRNRLKRIYRSLIQQMLLDIKGYFIFYPKLNSLSCSKVLLREEISKFKKFYQGYNH